MKISVVTTLYLSSQFIPEFHRRVRDAVQELGAGYELIFVNDGSPDDSLDVALGICRQDPNVRVLDLSRNFGHHPAIMAGLGDVTGDYVFLIDCDLEEAPENLVAFYHDLVANPETDVVYGVWQRSGEPPFRRIAASSYYALFNLMSDMKQPRNIAMSRLMTRRYVEALLSAWRWGVPLAPIMLSIGFVQRPYEIQRAFKGSSAYSVTRRMKVVVDAITSFSTRPLQYIFVLGMMVCTLSVVLTLYAVIGFLTWGQGVEGWYSVFVSIWFIGGLTMMSMGVLGVYIGRIFDQVKGRPPAILRHRYVHDELETRPEAAGVASRD
jgi:putative glycosyltransferase